MFDFDYFDNTGYQLEELDLDIDGGDWDIDNDIPDITENGSMITSVDSYADSTMLAQVYLAENINNGSCQISFCGQIDDLYGPSINSAQDDLIHHLEEATNARTTDDLEYHLDKAEEARISEDYWKDAKRSAEIEAEKRDIFIDGINKQWEIMDRYQSEMEDMSKRK